MKIPIQYAITYPERVSSDFPRISLKHLNKLTFEEPDFSKFECLKIAYDVIKMGGSYPVVLNASNEAAVDLFLNKKIKFTEIPQLITEALNKHKNHEKLELDSIIEIDKWSRKFVYDAASKNTFAVVN